MNYGPACGEGSLNLSGSAFPILCKKLRPRETEQKSAWSILTSQTTQARLLIPALWACVSCLAPLSLSFSTCKMGCKIRVPPPLSHRCEDNLQHMPNA